MKKLFLLIFFVATPCFMACKPVPPLPEGHCFSTEDCPEGTVCRSQWCEDIYHPRKEIKNY